MKHTKEAGVVEREETERQNESEEGNMDWDGLEFETAMPTSQ